MVVEAALNHLPQPLRYYRQQLMHAQPKFVLHLLYLDEEPLSNAHKELAIFP
jgi:hypothetical protein